MHSLTEEEFEQIIFELLETKPAKYDALCAAAAKLLTAPLRRKCAEMPALGQVCTYEDLLSETYIRLIKCAIPNFFLRTETVNRDREGFCRWMYTVAGNICRDKIRYSVSHEALSLEGESETEDAAPLQIADPSAEKPFAASEENAILAAAFETVLKMDMQVYKTITWVAQAVMILTEGVTKIESNDLLIQRFENMTLEAMWEEIRRAAKRLPWLRISDAAETRLRKIFDTKVNTIRYGDMRYGDFYMKKGAKASISDWVNRINASVRRKTEWNI